MGDTCPNCGLKYHTVKKPGVIDPWRGDLPVMVNPCTCVVETEEFKA